MRVYTEAIKKDGDEMMILKKKEVIAASLVVLIGLDTLTGHIRIP